MIGVRSFLVPTKILLIALLGCFVGFQGFRQFETWQLKQPYEFDHGAHRVMACVVCHVGAIEEIRATLPSFETCVKCHASSPLLDPDAEVQWATAVEAGGLEWNKITSVPDHVFFSHRQHTKTGQIECARCHGNVSDLSSPPPLPQIRVSMDECLDCHLQNDQTDDCARCHR